MSDVLLPTWLHAARTIFRYIDNTALSRGMYTGAALTTALGGDRLGASIEFTSTGGTAAATERRALISFLMQLKGRQNRAYLFDHAYRIGGSFSAPELLTNNTFSNGTTGWTARTGWSISVNDRCMRATFNNAASAGARQFGQTVSIAAYTPYALRMISYQGLGSIAPSGLIDGTPQGIATTNITEPCYSVNYTAGNPSSSVNMDVYNYLTIMGLKMGDYVDVPWLSLSKCFLVDNGQNLITYSDQFDNAAWTKSIGTITANATTAPDGTSTADAFVEVVGTGAPELYQSTTVSATALDYSHTVLAKKGTRNYVGLLLHESSGGTITHQVFDLNAGTIGASNSTGANWSNRRSVMVDYGGGWYLCNMVARKTNAATTIRQDIFANSTDSGSSYLMSNGATAIYLWRATLAQSSVPTRLVQTTSSATTGTTQTGNAIYVKGLPASTSGLLLPGDLVEINTSRGPELKFVTASLDSNSAGLGYLQFSPPLRGTVADNAPIVVNNPMGKFIFAGSSPGWDNSPGVITTASAEFEEA